MSLMIKKVTDNLPVDFREMYSQKYNTVVIKDENGNKFLFLHIFPKKFESIEEKTNFFRAALTLRVGECPKEIGEIHNGPNQDIVLMFIKQI